jgi:hypothetical protein
MLCFHILTADSAAFPLLSTWQLTLRVASFWQPAGLVAFCTGSDFSVSWAFSRLSAIDCASFYTALPFVIPA